MVDDRDRDHGDTLLDAHGATLAPPLEPAAAIAAGTAPLAIPTVDVAARYKLGEVIGKGGMGEIVLAVDAQIGREVAIKRIRGAQPTRDEVDRFVREACVQARLEHPAVVPVHEIAVDRAGKPFFVMKRLAGTTLEALLGRIRTGEDPDPDATRKRMLHAFAGVCLAIELAHSRGIVHRDLKPANIMLGDFGEVYVIDWGIARASHDDDRGAAALADLPITNETREGAVLGTPAYMAPEQLLGERVGPAADIYALGCILFEIAAGVPLHEQRTLASAITAADSSPSARRADSPPELDGICERATANDPSARFASARALGAAVQDYLDGDRDVAARKTLAAQHVADARAALARSDGERDRRTAMRAAGRALALDPTAVEAAELVSHLMLTPPAKVPREVEDRIAEIDTTTARAQGKIGAIAMLGYLGFVPLLAWTGIRDWRVISAFVVLALLTSGQVFWMTRQDAIPARGILVSAIIHAALIAVICRIVGPLLIAPTLVLTTLMAYAVHPRFGRISVITAILTAGVAVPWVLELAGVLAPTYHFADGALVLQSPAIAFTAAPVQLAFATTLGLLGAITAVLLRSMASRQRATTQTIELQAWHLRQIVPVR